MIDAQIVTRGIPATADEWMCALRMSLSKLPELTDGDKRRARMRHLNDEQHRRHLALRYLAKTRELQEATSLGEMVNHLLSEMKSEYRVKAIVKRGLESGWHVLLESKLRKKMDQHPKMSTMAKRLSERTVWAWNGFLFLYLNCWNPLFFVPWVEMRI